MSTTPRFGGCGIAIGLGLLAILAGILVLYATPYGPGTGWDQSMYIGSARNLLTGNGLTIPWGTDAGQPLTHFPPVFPLVLAALGIFGVDPLDGARYLNATLRGANLALLGMLMMRLTPGSVIGPVVTVGLFFTSLQMATLHDQAWSEPLFLPVCFAALYLLAQHVREPASRRRVMAAAALTALAIMIRYVGLAIVLAGAVLMVFATAAPPPRKLRDIALYAIVSLTPLALWAAVNTVLGQRAVGYRELAWHPATTAQLGQILYTFLDWFAPNQLVVRLVTSEGALSPIGLWLAVAIGVVLSMTVMRIVHVAPRTSADVFVTRVLPVFIGAYLLSVLVAVSIFDNLIQLDSRTLSPIYIALIIFAGIGAARLERTPIRARPALAACAALLTVAYLARFITGTQALHEQGVSYASKKYLASPIIQQLTQLPSDAVVYSNAPDGVYILTRRPSFAIPDATTIDADSTLIAAQLQQEHRPVYIAYFTDPDIAYRQLVPGILQARFQLSQVAEDPSGSLARLTELSGVEDQRGA